MFFNKKKSNKKSGKGKDGDAANDNRTTAKNLKIGDIIKVGVPVRIAAISTAGGTLHDALNRGQKVLSFEIAIDDGVFRGTSSTLSCTESDRVELIVTTRPTFLRRVRTFFSRLLRKSE